MNLAAPASGVQPAADPEAIKAIPVRHWGRWVLAVVVTAVLAAVLWAFASSDAIEWDAVGTYLTNDLIVRGAWYTLWLSVASMAIGIVIGVAVGVMRLSHNPVLSSIAWGYAWFFRGTPVLVQLIFWYSAVPLVFPELTISIPFTDSTLISREMNVLITPTIAALLGLGLNEGAYMSEIVRGGILSVDRGQTEASKALGMAPALTMRRVVLPQAMRVIIPPTGNEFISLLKTSSLAFVVQFRELYEAARGIYSTNLLTMELLIVISIWYLAMTSVFSVGQHYLERYYAAGTERGDRVGIASRIGRNLRPGRPGLPPRDTR